MLWEPWCRRVSREFTPKKKGCGVTFKRDPLLPREGRFFPTFSGIYPLFSPSETFPLLLSFNYLSIVRDAEKRGADLETSDWSAFDKLAPFAGPVIGIMRAGRARAFEYSSCGVSANCTKCFLFPFESNILSELRPSRLFESFGISMPFARA